MSQYVEPVTERPSPFDKVLRDLVLVPLAKRIPRNVHPNAITALTPLFASASFLCAAWAPYVEPLSGLWLRMGAGLGMFMSMLTDHIDGLHARNTGQASKLGEALDHWLDAYHVPLATCGLMFTMSIHPAVAAPVIMLNAMIYNAQLVVYHHTRKFVHPPMGGASAQTMLSFAYGVVGLILLLWPRSNSWLNAGFYFFCVITLINLARQVMFYLPLLGQRRWSHARFVLTGAVFALMMGLGVVHPYVGMALLVAASLRISGAYVLRTVLPRPYAGHDLALVGGAMLIAAAMATDLTTRVAGFGMVNLVGAAVCAVVVGSSVIDFITTALGLRHMAHPSAAA